MTITRTREEIAKLLTATDEPVMITLNWKELYDSYMEFKKDSLKSSIDTFAEDEDYQVEEDEYEELIDYILEHESDEVSFNSTLQSAFEYCDIKQMREFVVTVKFTAYGTKVVRAFDEDDAIERYNDEWGGEYDEYELEYDDWEVENAEEN